MSEYTVLLCDDNIAVHSSLTSYLNADGINVISAFTGEDALRELRQHSVDVVVLDVMLPGIDGLETCRTIRKFSNVYIIMLSAKGEEMDRVVGLEIGADDYVTKPFSPRELVIRIKKAMRRRYAKEEPNELKLAELTVQPDTYKVYVHDQEVNLTTREVKVLAFLVANAGMALTREQILNVAWGYEYYGDTRVVDTLIKRLRQKLPQEGTHFAIRSLYGVGYKIEERP